MRPRRHPGAARRIAPAARPAPPAPPAPTTRSREARPLHQRYAAAGRLGQQAARHALDLHPNALLARDGARVRARVHQLVRDYPPFVFAVSKMIDHLVGPGLRLQSMALAADGTPDRDARQRIEDAWWRWAEDPARCDQAQALPLDDLIELAQGQLCETGECLFHLIRERDRPLALQQYEPEQLAGGWRDALSRGGETVHPSAHPAVHLGVEIDPRTLRRLAYHLEDAQRPGHTLRVPAEDVVHGYFLGRPHQLRGVSPFVSAVLTALAHNDYLGSEVEAARLSARWLGVVVGGDPLADDRGDGATELDRATLHYLPQGADIKWAHADRPSDGLAKFTGFVLAQIAFATGFPYCVISNDYSGMNFTTLRAVFANFQGGLLRRQRRIQRVCQAIFQGWLDHEMLRGRLRLPGYWSRRDDYALASWQAPVLPAVDALREAKSDLVNIQSRLESPQAVLRRRGQDVEEVLREVAEWAQLCRDAGLDPVALGAGGATPGTGLANNPAAAVPEVAGGEES